MPYVRLKQVVLYILLLLPIIGKGQSASFTVDNASGCTPLIVHFANTSTGATSYSWNFGNSTSSALSDPSVSYIAPGNYTVTLTAYNGASSSIASMVISVYPLPVVSFTASDTTVCPGTAVTFNNTSFPGTSGTTSYTWNFGDGSTSNLANPVYTHATPGFYNISLFVTNSMGCFRSLTKPSYMQVYTPPVPLFSATGTLICQPPGIVPFANASTGTAPLAYNWSFGDGSASSSLPSPAHSYTAPGSYNVRLKVTDAKGCVDSMVRTGYVYVSDLNAEFHTPSSRCQLESVPFANFSTFHISRLWDFGDGFTSSDPIPTHAYALPGVYNIKLVIYDGSCYDTVVHPITINPNPTGSFTIVPTIPCPAPVNVTYNATVSPGSVVAWKFLDDSVATGSSVTHNYLAGRVDTTVMTVTNGFGCAITVEKKDTVYSFRVLPDATRVFGCAPYNTSFSATLTASAYNPLTEEFFDLPLPYVITAYSWNFGDGSPVVSGPTPSHTYTAVGAFTATCTVLTASGCVRTSSLIIRTGTAPAIAFTAAPTHICAGQNVNFTSTTTGTVNSYFWKYGDGRIDSGVFFANPTHKYTVPGIDTVRVRAYHNGCPSPEAKTWILIDSPNAVPVFNYLCIPNNGIAFGDSSLGADTRLWIFDDGTTSSIKNPVHYYPGLADFNVLLTTYNAASGCRDTVGIDVDLTPPLLFSVATDPTICLHQSTTLWGFIFGSSAQRYRWYDNGSLIIDTPIYNVSVPFNTQGLHDIFLEILDTRGCLDTLIRNDYLLVGNPNDSFTITPPVGCGPHTAVFNNFSTGIPECRLTSYMWDFGDGSIPVAAAVPGATNVYTVPGTYSVSLTVTDSIGCTATSSAPATVTVYRPHAAFYADANNICMGASAHFNNISTGGVSFLWIFGDGATSVTPAPYHVYTTSGIYTIRLVATDSHGCSDTATLYNYINVVLSPHASFTLSDSFAVCPPLNVNFTNTTTGAVSYNWNFGNSSSSVVVNPSSPYIASGYYTVRLVASNIAGCRDTAYRHVNVFGYTGAFSYTPVTGCLPQAVHFSASLGSFASLVWDFGDGVTSSVSMLDTISHVYPFQGMYVPKLILTDTTGCTNFSIGSDTIKVDKVIPNFRITPNPVCQGAATAFIDSSYSSYAAPSSWSWSFGSGATATGSAPFHTFTVAGTHVVTLTATNGYGCNATVTKTVTVNAVPDTIAGSRAVCAGFTTTLTNTSPLGSWTSSAPGIASVTAGGVVTGIVAGTATITYTLSAGCISTAVVTVYALPGTITGSNSVCEGGTIALSNTTSGGSWSSSAPLKATINVSGMVTGVSAGTAVITYTLGSGCIAVKTITINQTPLPITGSSAVCKSSSITLVESLTGGSWSSGDPLVATVDASGNVTGIGAGTVRITYAFVTGCLANKLITVNPLPDTIVGNASVCAGANVALSCATIGGTWSSSNIVVALANPLTGVVNGVSAGVVNITYTLPTGCVTFRPFTVDPVPAPIYGTMFICNHATTALFQSASGGTWISGNPAVAVVDGAGLVTGVAAGSTAITYSFITGCKVEAVVTVNPLPDTIAGNPSLCYGFSTALSETTTGGVWSSTDPSVAPVSTSGVVTALTFGTSIISYTLPTGCAAKVVVTVNSIPDPITGITNACIGSHVHLSTTSTGGTWASADVYVATIDMYSGDYVGHNAGTVIISYISAAGCVTYTILTIEALPPSIVGGPTVCAGFAVNLTNAMPGGTWSSDPAASLVGTIHPVTGVVTGITPGTVTVTYTIMTGCTRNLVVTVLPLPSVISGPPAVCVGETVTLSNSTPGGTWSSSDTAKALVNTISGVVAGVAAGNVVITYHVSTGCFNILHMTVNPLPAPVAGYGHVCEGSNVALSTGTTGGIWISGHTDTATVTYTGGVVTGVDAGVVPISYVLATGCMVVKQMTVDPTPPLISGTPHICIGSFVSLSNAMAGGAWFSSNSAVATVGTASGVVTSVALGTAYISYILPVTGCTAIKLVTVHPLPAVYNVTGGGNYCSGAAGVHVGLSGSQPGVSYVLYYGSAATGYMAGTGFPLDFGMLTPAGIYTVQATDVTSGCMRNMTGSALVNIMPLVTPVVAVAPSPDDSSCTGQTVTFTSLLTNGGSAPSFLWKVNGVVVSSLPAYSFIPAHGDVVSVTATSNAACLATATATGALTMTVLPYSDPLVAVSVLPGDTVCQFSPAVFTALPTYGGYTPQYFWKVNGTFAGTGISYSYVPLQADVVSCIMTSNYRCRLQDSAFSADVTVTVDSLTPPRVTIVADPGLAIPPGAPVTLHAYAEHAGSAPAYQWRVNGYPVSGATNAIYTAVFNNKDSVVCVVTSNGVCSDLSSFAWVFITAQPPLVANIMAEEELTLLPNPNTGSFVLRGNGLLVNADPIPFSVLDVIGQVVYKGYLQVKDGRVEQEVVLGADLANGMYLLQTDIAGDRKVFHFVLKR